MSEPALPALLEAVLFDAGGTLVQLDYSFIAETARARGAPLREQALPAADAAARRAIDRRLLATAGDGDEGRRSLYLETLLEAAGAAPAAVGAVARALDRAHRTRNLWRVPMPGAEALLRALRGRGLRTAVVSNADGTVERVLASVGLAAHLDLILDSQLEGVEKPDPEIFRRALARLEVPAERALYIGDIYSIDAVGARAAGLEPVIIDPTGGYGALDCIRVASLGELLDRVERGRRA